MRISDWSADVCSSDLLGGLARAAFDNRRARTVAAADLDLARLLVLGHFADEIDVQKAMLIASPRHLDRVGKLEAPFKGALGDSAVQELPVSRFRPFLGAAGHGQARKSTRLNSSP